MSDTNAILFVDDDEFVLEMYALKFKQAGFNLEFARDGKEALTKIAPGKYQLIISDMIMPHTNGFDLIEELDRLGITKTTPVLVLTNLGEEEGKEKCMAHGATDYMLKAYSTPTEIVEKVKQIISSHS
ncbi:MAG: response regulator [Patescibacteria group bacterium]